MATGKMEGDRALLRRFQRRHRHQGTMGPWRGGTQKHTSLMGENHHIGNLLGEARMRARGKTVVKASQMKKTSKLNKAQEGRRGAMKRRLGLDWEKSSSNK